VGSLKRMRKEMQLKYPGYLKQVTNDIDLLSIPFLN
jgi:hypothetical protein